MPRWKQIPGFPAYDISDDGRVMKARANLRNRGVGRILTPSANSNGVMTVGLYDGDGVRHAKAVHRLVAKAFVPNPDGKEWVGNVNEDKSNNHYSNLCWRDQPESAQLKVRRGRQRSASTGMRVTLTIEQAREMRAAYDGKPGSTTALARHYGVSVSTASLILLGRIYREAA